MFYNVKVSATAIEEIKKVLGVSSGRINLNTGVIAVEDINDVKQLAGKYEIENVNFKPYEEVIGEAKPASKKPQKELTQEERNNIIGCEIEFGTIVRVIDEKEVKHVVISTVNDDSTYNAVLVELRKPHPAGQEPQVEEIPMVKGIDVVYRNQTYKEVVTLVSAVMTDLSNDDFMKKAGGTIVGRVINQELLDKIEDWTEMALNPEKGDGDDDIFADEPVLFKTTLLQVKTVDEIIDQLQIRSECLLAAVEECVRLKSSNMKNLVKRLQFTFAGTSQKELTGMLEAAVANWIENINPVIEEPTVSYFFKEIAQWARNV